MDFRLFQCKYCGKAFASHAAHDSHVRRTHKIMTKGSVSSTATATASSARPEEIIDVVA